ncbi:uncharacterized protein ACLA_070360 [Aspergillus clavatus NRRL 1]|uniref:Uncharacterized protein n=1 Tax=Aspergillus clavatus (strain ATCC 1007 / CBS 513.65 / DSM 816 / NCTC 3887 / NRRL 1 / QM 1276 / 107) TaxID=344612 RepID=A1C6I3_ASPCL|nr:uncharacterized protein ACLA_070360 [Aspergillus clavatus NRRL 1]EAW14004.1 hypothetical protein ACLA_070360 [Aspergillus clavatus NRRL 1]
MDRSRPYIVNWLERYPIIKRELLEFSAVNGDRMEVYFVQFLRFRVRAPCGSENVSDSRLVVLKRTRKKYVISSRNFSLFDDDAVPVYMTTGKCGTAMAKKHVY